MFSLLRVNHDQIVICGARQKILSSIRDLKSQRGVQPPIPLLLISTLTSRVDHLLSELYLIAFYL
jgi:hypothetical protein